MIKKVIVILVAVMFISGSFGINALSTLLKSQDQGFMAKGNKIIFRAKNYPEVSWQLAGSLIDLRTIQRKKLSGTEEIKYVAIYQDSRKEISELLLTQRILPNGDNMLFVTAYSGKGDQRLIMNIPKGDYIYTSNGFIYQDKGDINTLIREISADQLRQVAISHEESFDQWLILAKDSLNIADSFVARAWQVSEDYHKSVNWISEKGTYRKTPDAYQELIDSRNHNINLQASAPNILLESLQIQSSRLIEDVVHNVAFTLKSLQDSDGFWRAGVNVAYLNRAYQLGPNYIDTRLSVDASLFLLRYGLMYNDSDAVERGKAFKKYFLILKDKGYIYQNEEGILYPDYYSEQQNNKSLVSLNHALYEMNYLYTLYNWTSDLQAKEIADEMLKFINNTYNQWITPQGDLYYALGPKGNYYGTDYLNVTYIDLFTSLGILRYMNYDASAISTLFNTKGSYLTNLPATDFDSLISLDFLYDNLGEKHSKKGDLFMHYPLELHQAAGYELSYSAYGTFHFITGVDRITYLDKEYQLSPNQKYLVMMEKEKLVIKD